MKTNKQKIEELTDALLATGMRVAALQTILIDILANQCMAQTQPDPVRFAEKYRERFRNMLAQNPEAYDPEDPGYSEIVSGEKADAVDQFLEQVVATVRKRQARRGLP